MNIGRVAAWAVGVVEAGSLRERVMRFFGTVSFSLMDSSALDLSERAGLRC